MGPAGWFGAGLVLELVLGGKFRCQSTAGVGSWTGAGSGAGSGTSRFGAVVPEKLRLAPEQALGLELCSDGRLRRVREVVRI